MPITIIPFACGVSRAIGDSGSEKRSTLGRCINAKWRADQRGRDIWCNLQKGDGRLELTGPGGEVEGAFEGGACVDRLAVGDDDALERKLE